MKSLESSESDSEELPTFSFLKKEPSSTERRQPQRAEKIVVIDSSDSEASCPLSPGLKDPPPVSDTDETLTQTKPVGVLSSGSESEEEFVPLAERLKCKFLTYKQLNSEHCSSPVKSVLNHQNNEEASSDWKKQPFSKIPDVSLHVTLKRSVLGNQDPVLDNPCIQPPAYQFTHLVQNNSLEVTKTNSDVPQPQKRTKHRKNVPRRDLQRCQLQEKAGQKESTPRQQEKKKATLVNRLKAQRPEECLKHIVVVLDPGSPSICLHPELNCLLSGPPTDRLFPICCSAFTDGRAQNPPRRRKQGASSKQAKEKQQRREPSTGPVVSRVEVEEALVDLQLHTEAQVQIVQSWKELADFACTFTKAVAEAPFKTLRDENSFSFCLESDWAGGVKVDRTGRGLALVWRRQIQQLNRVSLEMASAIVDTYPSPRLLVEAYQRCFSEQERQNLLADIQVRRGEGVTSTSRRIGPEVSRRVYLQMTSLQPDLTLDSAD
ncbi:hypothetical protein GHT09_020127 [Marmota monax]|uniref:ERCC4 domain-containing protein n=1 Tax=Marmota monax TaxID=9995 RepID=A0A834URP5_MARMO|nr:hypothetical protein GHT09_020127 [Marmota monax]